MVAPTLHRPTDPEVSEATREFALWRRERVILTGLGVLVGSFLLAWAVHDAWFSGVTPVVESSFNAFAVLFVLALVVERLLQPFVPLLGPDTDEAKKILNEAVATLTPDSNLVEALTKAMTSEEELRDAAQSVAVAKSTVAESREQTSAIAWAVASGVGFLLSAVLGIGILDVILVSGAPAFPVDMAVTGMVIGAGTKPLNDLWTRLQNKPTT